MHKSTPFWINVGSLRIASRTFVNKWDFVLVDDVKLIWPVWPAFVKTVQSQLIGGNSVRVEGFSSVAESVELP